LVSEGFALSIEMLGCGGGLCDEDGGFEGKMFISSVKPTVHFKFIIGKKLNGEYSDTIHET
jgi:hypothetical protein